MPKIYQAQTVAVVLGLGLIVSGMPAVAQTTSNTAGNLTASTNPLNTSIDKVPNGSLEKYHGLLRTTELDGANVYNDQGTVIGTIHDMLVGDDGKVQNAVISVGGFLGVGTHYVSVPFRQIQVQPSRASNVVPGMAGDIAGVPGTTSPVNTTNTTAMSNSMAVPNPSSTSTGVAPTTATPNGNSAARMQYFSLMLSGATKDSLTKMPEFRYRID